MENFENFWQKFSEAFFSKLVSRMFFIVLIHPLRKQIYNMERFDFTKNAYVFAEGCLCLMPMPNVPHFLKNQNVPHF